MTTQSRRKEIDLAQYEYDNRCPEDLEDSYELSEEDKEAKLQRQIDAEEELDFD